MVEFWGTLEIIVSHSDLSVVSLLRVYGSSVEGARDTRGSRGRGKEYVSMSPDEDGVSLQWVRYTHPRSSGGMTHVLTFTVLLNTCFALNNRVQWLYRSRQIEVLSDSGPRV